jgi:hypothetical protein
MHAVGIVLTVAVLAFYLTRTKNYNYGGNTAGLRWAFWLIPFWLLALVPLLDRFSRRRWFLGTAGVLLALSVASVASASSNPWQPSWLYTLMKNWEWIDYDTRPPELPRRLTTFISTLPPVDTADPAWIEFSSPEADGSLTILRLEDGGRLARQETPVRKVIATWRFASARAETRTYYIDEEKFYAGQFPREFLLWPDGVPNASARHRAESFLRNLPHPRPYNADHIRYLKTPLRPDAFHCQQAASRVNYAGPGQRPLSYRSDIWICDQLPFGVVRFQSIVSDAVTGETVEYRRFDVANASWYYEKSPSE